VITMIENVEFRGYRNLWLALEGGNATPAEIDADRISCEAGLGGRTPGDEVRILPEFLRKIRKRMAPWGGTIPLFPHPRLGPVYADRVDWRCAARMDLALTAHPSLLSPSPA